MPYSKIVYFKNWTDKDFTYKYDSKEQTFEAGQMYSLPAEIADHFAHHLAIRECFAHALEFLPEGKMREFKEKCFPGGMPDAFQHQGLPIDKIEVLHGHATEAPVAIEGNKTDSDIQQEVPVKDEPVTANKTLKRAPRKKAAVTTDNQYTA